MDSNHALVSRRAVFPLANTTKHMPFACVVRRNCPLLFPFKGTRQRPGLVKIRGTRR